MEDINPYLNDGTMITDYRNSLSLQHEKLALEDHSYIAAPKERARYEKNSVLSLNKEGVQGPMNQSPDFAEAKQKFKRLHDEYVKETSDGNTPIHPTQRTRQRRNQQIEGLEEYDYQVDPQTGWRTYSSRSRGNPRQPASSSSFLGDLHPGLKRCYFRLPEI